MNPDLMTATDQAEEASHDRFRDATRKVRRRAGEAFEQGDQYVRQNPWTVILGAAAVGLVMGMAFSRRHEPTMRERYLNEPADQVREMLFSILAPVAKRLQQEYGHLRSSVKGASEHLRDMDAGRLVEPLSQQANRLGKFFRFW